VYSTTIEEFDMSDQANEGANPGRPSEQDTGSTTGDDELAVLLSELARALGNEPDTDETLDRIVQEAITLVPGVEEGSISVVTGREHVVSQAPSSDLPATVDKLQENVGEGPCLEAVYTQRTVRVSDMASESRWPNFARAASDAGVGSMLSFQLYVRGDNLGALNLYATEAGAFDDESEHVGLLFASHAAVAFAAIQKHDKLALESTTRDLISQAKGILVERYKVTGHQAFALLVRASTRQGSSLREVAAGIVEQAEPAAHSSPRA
jgi:transcriptional regulator with GAF, ATPase, and Fis domain